MNLGFVEPKNYDFENPPMPFKKIHYYKYKISYESKYLLRMRNYKKLRINQN